MPDAAVFGIFAYKNGPINTFMSTITIFSVIFEPAISFSQGSSCPGW